VKEQKCSCRILIRCFIFISNHNFCIKTLIFTYNSCWIISNFRQFSQLNSSIIVHYRDTLSTWVIVLDRQDNQFYWYWTVNSDKGGTKTEVHEWTRDHKVMFFVLLSYRKLENAIVEYLLITVADMHYQSSTDTKNRYHRSSFAKFASLWPSRNLYNKGKWQESFSSEIALTLKSDEYHLC
jgi:hypothetical protein